jgi:hypothetical protein
MRLELEREAGEGEEHVAGKAGQGNVIYGVPPTYRIESGGQTDRRKASFRRASSLAEGHELEGWVALRSHEKER